MHNRISSLVLMIVALVCVFCADASAQSDSEFNKSFLSNGIAVVTQESKADVASACLLIRVGIKDEGSKRGVTALLNSVLLSSNPMGKKSPAALRIEQLGGFVTSEVGMDYTCFRLSAPVGRFQDALNALADMFGGPEITESSFGREKESLALELGREDDSIVQRGYRLVTKAAIGTDTSIDKGSLTGLTNRDAAVWYARHYRPEKMLLSVCGRLSHQKMAKLASQAFSGLQGAPVVPPEEKVVQPRRKASGDDETEKSDAAILVGSRQSAVFYGIKSTPGSPDYPAQYVIYTLVSDGMSSGMYKKLRRDSQLSYDFGGFLPTPGGTPVLAFYAVTDPDRLDAASESLAAAIKSMATDVVSKEELDIAKNRILLNMPDNSGATLCNAYYAGIYELTGLGAGYGRKLSGMIDKLGPDDIARAASALSKDMVSIKLRPERGGR